MLRLFGGKSNLFTTQFCQKNVGSKLSVLSARLVGDNCVKSTIDSSIEPVQGPGALYD